MSAGRLALSSWAIANVVSITGSRLSMVALPWFVLTSTGSPTMTGLVGLAEMLPYILAKAFAGPLIDRVGARRISVTADLVSTGVVGIVPLLHHSGALPMPVLLGLVAIAGLVRGPGDGAKTAMAPHIGAIANVPLERVTGISSAGERLATTIGVALAGLVVSVVGPVTALALDAASFGLAAILIGAGVPASSRAEPTTSDSSYLTRMAEGWNFLRRDPVLVVLVTMVATTNLLDLACSTVLVPLWALDSDRGPGAIGLVFGVTSGAALLGALTAATVASRLPRLPTYLVAFLIGGAPRIIVLAFDRPIGVVLGVTAVSGFAIGFVNPILSALSFERIPESLTGRVTSLQSSLCWVTVPFGGLVGGALVAAVGLSPALLVVGSTYLAATMLPAILPQWRHLERPGGDVTTRRPHASRRAAGRPA